MTAIVIGLSCLCSNGQSTSELRKLWQNNNDIFHIPNQRDKLFSRTDFYKYARIRDEEFAEYLKEPWQDCSIIPGLYEELRKYPIENPVFNASDLVMHPPENLPFSNVVGFNYNLTSKVNLIPRIRKPETDKFTTVKAIFNFYGQSISVNYDTLMKFSKVNRVSEDSISEFWKLFSRTNSNHLVDQLMDYRDMLGLGDWGYFQLVKATSNYIFTNDTLNANLLTWAFMIRSGFDVRFAFNQNSSTILFPSENIIYSRQFVIIGQKRFYLDHKMNSQLLVTCQNPFPDNVGMIDLKLYKSLNFNGKLTIRKFLYQWNNKNYEFTLRYNPEVIRFYKDYPPTDPVVYFGTPVTSSLKEDLLGAFYPLLSKMDKTEAVAFLQQFIQKQFGFGSLNQKESEGKCRFAEEVIASKSGDSRSKSVLFSWLIRILLRTPVVGVQFPEFYSLAVGIEKHLDGDFYYLNRQKYYIADPTFLNAPIGVSMPEFTGLTPRLIDLSNSFLQPERALEIWKLAYRMGARRGGTWQDVVFDRQGRSMITGYFTDKIVYYPFIACFSHENSLQWIRKFEGDGEAVAFAITKFGDDEIYVAGSFNGKIQMDGTTLQSGGDNADLFIAQFNSNGELIWMNKAGIDSTAQDDLLTYSVNFDRSGENISTQWSNEDLRNVIVGFGEVSETGLCFTGIGSLTPGMIPLVWNRSDHDFSVDFFKEYNLLIKSKCHQQLAGIVAVMKLLKKSGTIVTGKQLQKLISHCSTTFQIDNTALFKMIGQIQFIKNENGNLSIRTIEGKPLLYNYIKIEDGARFNLSFFGNGDLSVGILSGFQKIVKQVTLPLNSLLFDISSGNLILDYDHDHTIKTISPGIILSTK